MELAPLLLKANMPVKVETLKFGDFAFAGNGPKGLAMVGVERKCLKDMLNCIGDHRWSGHQLPGLIEHYEFRYLIVEGFWRPRAEDGLMETLVGREWKPLELGRRTFMYRDLDKFLNSVEMMTPVRVRRTNHPQETVTALKNLYSSWVDKEFSEHKSHFGFYVPPMTGPVSFEPPSLIRRVAKEFDGIGWERSRGVELRFGSVLEMCQASMEEWELVRIPGKRGSGVGPKTARKVWHEIRGLEIPEC